MKKVLTLAVAALLVNLAPPAAALNAAPLAASVAAGTVKVTVTYKGKGTVDASHKLWVWVFDTPNIGRRLRCRSIRSRSTRTAPTRCSKDVVADKVWIAVAFDESGAMKGDGPPPTGHTDRHSDGEGWRPRCGDVWSQGCRRADVRRFAAHAVIPRR